MKDNFSEQADAYARFRPSYPDKLFDYLCSLVTNRDNAWDCGTGNGQVAVALSPYFKEVFATDISQAQLDHAIAAHNVRYSSQPAEQTDFAASVFQLIVAAQAAHWFDLPKFYEEVSRTASRCCLLCLMGYGNVQPEGRLLDVVTRFYRDVTGPYWDQERQMVDEHYRNLPFPCPEIEPPEFSIQLQWTRRELAGYISTWSGVKHLVRKEGREPLRYFEKELNAAWPSKETIRVRFPVFMRLGRLP